MMVIGHLIIVTEDSGYNKDGDLVTGDSMNCSVYNVHCSSTSVASLCDQTALPAIPLPGTAQWVSRYSLSLSDFQIGRKGGNGIKFNGMVTAKRFWKKKSRK